jgi:biopolymer transport protein ExbD
MSRPRFDDDECRMDLTPVIDMSFLLVVFFICLPFKSLDAKLAAYLPTNRGIRETLQPEVKVDVRVVISEEGAGARYRIDGETTRDLEVLLRRIEAAKGTKLEVRGRIQAGAKVPTKYVVAVLNQFAAASVTDVEFFGTPIPTAGIRHAK